MKVDSMERLTAVLKGEMTVEMMVSSSVDWTADRLDYSWVDALVTM